MKDRGTIRKRNGTKNQIGVDSPSSFVDTFVFQTETPDLKSGITPRFRQCRRGARLVAGPYYEHDDIERPYQYVAATNSTLAVCIGRSFYDASAKIDTAAVFGQLGYQFGNRFKVDGQRALST